MVRRRQTADLLHAVGVDVVDADAERLPPALADHYLSLRPTGCCRSAQRPAPLLQQPGEVGPLVVGEAGEQAALVGDVAGEQVVDQGPARLGEGDRAGPGVVGGDGPGDVALASRRSTRLVTAPEVTIVVAASSLGVSANGAPARAQRGDHVEVAVGEARLGEQRPELGVERVGQPVQPADDPQRAGVEVGSLARPLLQDPADVVRFVGLMPLTISSLED